MPKSDGQAALFKPQRDDPQCAFLPFCRYAKRMPSSLLKHQQNNKKSLHRIE